MSNQDSPINFFEKFREQIVGGVNSCMLGRIERFNAVAMKAEVKPLVKYKNEDGSTEEKPLLIEVPVSFTKAGPFIIRPSYRKGDIVLVVFSDDDIQNVLISGGVSETDSSEKHSLSNGIVVGGIMPFTKNLPDVNTDDLVIAKEDFSTKIVIKEDGGIIIQGGNVYLGNEDATEGIPLGDTLKEWLDNHTHPYNWSDSGGSGDTSRPSMASPKTSEVVKSI